MNQHEFMAGFMRGCREAFQDDIEQDFAFKSPEYERAYWIGFKSKRRCGEQLMDKQDVINILGEPDRITRNPMMVSGNWFCPNCGKLHVFVVPVPPPAPCKHCGGIIFEKRSTPAKDSNA